MDIYTEYLYPDTNGDTDFPTTTLQKWPKVSNFFVIKLWNFAEYILPCIKYFLTKWRLLEVVSRCFEYSYSNKSDS